MTLKDANCEVERLDNEIELWLKEKEVLEASVDIQAVSTDKMIVDGGKRVDKLLEYVEIKEIKQLDEKIQLKQSRKLNLMDWIEKELKILKKYDKVEQLIVYYKDICLKKYTWREIATLVHYSKEQCQRIYKKYHKLRFFNKDDTLWHVFFDTMIMWENLKVLIWIIIQIKPFLHANLIVSVLMIYKKICFAHFVDCLFFYWCNAKYIVSAVSINFGTKENTVIC